MRAIPPSPLIPAAPQTPPTPFSDMTESISAPADSLAWEMRDIRGVGRYAIPNYPWWEAERAVILAEQLEFNAQAFLFDTILTTHLPFLKRTRQDTRQQTQQIILMRNLSVLRNFLMQTQYGKAGIVSPQARIATEKLALQTAAMLKRGQGFLASITGMLAYPGAGRVGFSAAAEERSGAALLYRALYDLRYRPGSLRTFLQSLKVIPTPTWELPPLEDTPFHPTHLRAALMEKKNIVTIPAPPPRDAMELPAAMAGVQAVLEVEDVDIGDGMLLSVDTLSEAVKREAIDIAHDILKNLKVQFEQVPLREMINLDPNMLRDSFDDLSIVLQVYDTYLELAANAKPAILEDELILEANLAIGKLMYQAKRFELQQAMRANDGGRIAELHKELGAFPSSMSQGNESVSSVLDTVEKALDKVMGVLRTTSVEAPGENALGRGGGRSLGAVSDQEAQLAQLVGLGEEYQRMMAQQQQQQNLIAQQTHLATQQQQMQRQQRWQQERTGSGQGGQASSQADLRRQQMRQQRQQQQQRMQQRIQQLRQQQQQRTQRQQQARHDHDHHYEHLLHGDDLHHLRDSLNKPMTGELVQPGNAKEAIRRERERLDKQKQQGKSGSGKVAAPPPRPGAATPLQAHDSDVIAPPSSPEDPNRPQPSRKQRPSR